AATVAARRVDITTILDIQDELVNIKGGNKKEDPYEKLFKDLSKNQKPSFDTPTIQLPDKKCVDAIKLLLQDPVGRADFALESSGGRIISVDAGSYTARSKLLGFTLCEGSHTASAMIRATSSPGECWAFKGQTGSAIIQLIGHVLIDSVTLEHISAKLSPTGTIDSAPKNFKIWGLAQPNRKNRAILGEFTYENDGTTLQTFKVNNTNYYKYIEFEVLSNHGNKEYTCVY
ncbi:SUN domain-containing protein 3-like, partial [Asbolus verrucosus]